MKLITLVDTIECVSRRHDLVDIWLELEREISVDFGNRSRWSRLIMLRFIFVLDLWESSLRGFVGIHATMSSLSVQAFEAPVTWLAM